ncbi:unnamed protein product [Lepeophtheirus salmonis]|uniref:(salmon louse) hypothetical protein n=1 Tax=Lepeophtheirus salmonis TaxID=72036 RepID=A0A817FGF4_LEPSM|nr:unnamed protein product [Lepeophtheirus salmonis]CAG9478473.1 unnamed protein product [Lepeophtheirus salmonis]
MEKLVCRTDNRMCMIHRCDHCPSSDAFVNYWEKNWETLMLTQCSTIPNGKPPIEQLFPTSSKHAMMKTYRITDPKISSNRTKILEMNVDNLFKEFGDVFDVGKIMKPMICDPVKINLQKNAKPFCKNGTRPMTYALREKTKKELDSIEKKWCY